MRTMLLWLAVLLPFVALAQAAPDAQAPTQAQLPAAAPTQAELPSAPRQAELPPPTAANADTSSASDTAPSTSDTGPATDQSGPSQEAPITATPDDAQPTEEGPTSAVLPPPVTPGPPTASAPEGPIEIPLIENHPRTGPFLSGPGSFMFVTTHTLLGTAGGLTTMGVSNHWNFDVGSREAILAGTLVGAGIGFGTSAWWQFHHWIGRTSAAMTLTDSIVGGMAVTGLVNLTTTDQTALAWASFLGGEVGAWLTTGIGGGDMPLEHAMLLATGEGWAEIYGALLLAIVHFSGSSLTSRAGADTLLIAPAVGATFLAFATSRFHPTPRQILRANVSGAAIGGTVLLLSALLLGHLDSPTPYALAMASSATTMAIVSIFWDDRAAPPTLGHAPPPYRSVWW